MTLTEVVVAMAIIGLVVGGIVTGYSYCGHSTEKTALALAANARAMEIIEETRSAKWDTVSWPQVDEVVQTNFPTKVVTLDLSGDTKMLTKATVQTTISQISNNPPLKRIRVDCIWKFNNSQLMTNSIETCRAPDQ